MFAPRLYNSLLKYQKDVVIVKTEKFKLEFDKFLELIPDEPKMAYYNTAARSNSILNQLSHRRAHGIFNSCEVADDSVGRAGLTSSKLLQGAYAYRQIDVVL